jgi:uncharacterized protein with beta-barrel porin domain
MTSIRCTNFRRSLLAAASVTCLFGAGAAHAQSASDSGLQLEANEAILANHLVPQGPANVLPGINQPNNGSIYSNSPQVLDPVGSINGVGQQIAFIQSTPTAAGLSLCTGSLINPRTVITAAHCVFNNPAHMYGSKTGTGGGTYGTVAQNFGTTAGIPISFGFESLNRNCLNANGLPFTCPAGQKGPYETWRDGGFNTSTARHIYNGNQVWYGTGAQPVALGGLGEFANKDIALVTLDTHAKDIPTWTLLFSPLDGPTHATITGYGTAGTGLSGIGNLGGIDYRRRSAENMIDALISTHDFNSSPGIGGAANTTFITHQHAIYWMDFDDPTYNSSVGNVPANFSFQTPAPALPARSQYYDFNGLGGTTLPNEGSTGGGDSGGPLVVDRRFTNPDGSYKSVIAGVLTGSFSFNGGIGLYGQFNVYPPLFQFWEEIVQNNPYVYASALAGDGDWFDPTHWVQDMDPNYGIIGPDGKLLNSLPDTIQGGADGAVDKFGTVCFLQQNCKTFDGPGAPTGNGTPIVTAGGPGSTNFAPNNVEPVNSATPGQTVKARYYDVTLRRAGTTTLNQAATIDAMKLDHNQAKLLIGPNGKLSTWADYTQTSGWTQVDGLLNTNEMLVVSGLLSGKGTITADYLTVVGGIVAPAGSGIGTLSVNGDVILASASALLVDVTRGAADKLAVTGSLTLSGPSTPGASLVLSKTGAAPKHGDSYTLATASAGVLGTFGQVYSFQGVLRPELVYTANSVVANMRAGSLANHIGGSGATEIAFARALDQLRGNYYDNLSGLYGSVDLMSPEALRTTLRGLAPDVAGEARTLQDDQSRVMLNGITDRLSLLGTEGNAGKLSIVGAPEALALLGTGQAAQSVVNGTMGLAPSGRAATVLPKGFSGFVSGGFTTNGANLDGSKASFRGGQRSWHVGMGLEIALDESFTLGTAFGIADGYSLRGDAGERADTRSSQMAVYGSYKLGGGFYVGGVAAAEMSRASFERQASSGDAVFDLTGATESRRYTAMAEAGVNLGIGRGLTVTPRLGLGYSSYNLSGYRENGGEVALQLDDMTVRQLNGRMGARLAGATRLGKWALVPQFQADYVRNFSGSGNGVEVRFADAGGYAFTLPLGQGDTDWAEVKGGFKLSNGPLEFGAGVETSLGRTDYRDDRATADFTFRF